MNSADAGAQIVDKRKNWEARVEMMVFKRPSSELSTYDKLVYTILCGHANRDGNAMLYVRTIAEEASCSERQVQRALSNLETRGLLIRRPQNYNKRQTFNIYEVYGFEAYVSSESLDKLTMKAGPGNASETSDPGVSDSRPCMSDTLRQSVTSSPSVSHPKGDCVAELNNVFKQPLNNSLKNNNSPLTPQGVREGRGEKSEIQKTQNQRHDTEEKGRSKETSAAYPEFLLQDAIWAAFNETLPELPRVEKLTTSRTRTLNFRIAEAPERKEIGWWRKYFERVRLFPWLMGQNPNNWKATFDWLIGEDGMRKVIEGGFTQASRPEYSREELREWQRRYTDERGIVDAKALLRDWRASTAGTNPHGNG